MTDKRVFKLVHAEARRRAIQAVTEAPDGFAVTVQEPTRKLTQNSLLWPLLQAFADQLQWPVNGQMVWLSADEWKDLLSCAFRKEAVRVSPSLDGQGLVMLGSRTSKFSVREMSEFLDFIQATAAARYVDLHYMEAS